VALILPPEKLQDCLYRTHMAQTLRVDHSPKDNQTPPVRPILVSRTGSSPAVPQFATIEPKRQWRFFAYSYLVEAVVVIVLANIVFLAPLQDAPRKNYQKIELIADFRPKPMPPKVTPKITAPPRVVVEKITPKVELPKPEVVPPPVIAKVQPPPRPTPAPPTPPKVETGKFDAPPAQIARGNPTRPLETGVFSGSSAPVTVKAPVHAVQTGGFGDPNGLPGKGPENAHLRAPSVGSFDLPGGPGQGNGTGGSKGIRGTVASAGFGNGVAGPGNGDHGGAARGSVRESGFGDYEPAAREVRTQASAPVAATSPVEVLAKPTPAYTEEARRLKIEGEVLLQVVFLASGQVQVVKVVRGLGHGLDESAVNAAGKIRFKPAQRAGQSVDYTATIHIVFQIA
jgi:TonB family protein